MTLLGPQQRLVSTRTSFCLRLPCLGLQFFLFDRCCQFRELLRGKLANRVDLIFRQVTPDQIARLNFQPWIVAVPLDNQAPDAELPASLIPMPSIENLSTVDENGNFDPVAANVLLQSLVVVRRKRREKQGDGMRDERFAHARLAEVAKEML